MGWIEKHILKITRCMAHKLNPRSPAGAEGEWKASTPGPHHLLPTTLGTWRYTGQTFQLGRSCLLSQAESCPVKPTTQPINFSSHIP